MDNVTRTSRRGLQSIAPLFVNLFERTMPDPFVLAVGLTALVAALALLLAPNGTPDVILTSWYAGIFNILGFAFQMILILATGHALANAPPVAHGLRRLVSRANDPQPGRRADLPDRRRRLLAQLGLRSCGRRHAGAGSCTPGPGRFRLAGGRCLLRLGDLGQRPVQLHRLVASHPRQRPEHRRETDRPVAAVFRDRIRRF